MRSRNCEGISKSLREREVLKLSLIQDAMRRLEAGTYGLCGSCGEPVAFERLLVFPETGTCGGCRE